MTHVPYPAGDKAKRLLEILYDERLGEPLLKGSPMIRRVIPHDPDMPEEHPALDVEIRATAEPGALSLVSLHQGNDWLLLPGEHARRLNAALSEMLSAFPENAEAEHPEDHLHGSNPLP